MAYIFGGAAVLIVLILLGRAFIGADPRTLVRFAPLRHRCRDDRASAACSCSPGASNSACR